MHCVCSLAHCRYGGSVYSLASPSPSPWRASSTGSSRWRSSRGRGEPQRFQGGWRDGDGYRSRIPRFRTGERSWNRGRGQGEEDDDSEKYFVARYQGDEEVSGEEDLFSDEEENTAKVQKSNDEPKTLARDFLRKLRSRRIGGQGDASIATVSDEEDESDFNEERQSSRRKEVETYSRERKVAGTLSRSKNEMKETDKRSSRKEYGSRSSTAFSNKTYDSEDDYFTRDRRERPERPREDGTGSKRDEKTKRVDSFFSTKKFQSLGASQEIISALSSLEIVRPSEIQALSYKQVMNSNSCIIADQTGSGKTLAYLAPLVQRLREDEERGNFSTPKNPRVLVLAPTSELAMQVLTVCRALSTTCPLKSMVATGGFKWKTQVENLASGPDIVIATPGRFLHHLDEETIQLGKLQSVVLDEVDILFEEEEFVEAMTRVRKLAAQDVQYIHVTATLPTDVHDKILNKHPDSVPVLGPSLHLTAPGLNEVLVDCSGDEHAEKTPEAAFANKKEQLLNLLEEKSVMKTIIFCNKIETCRKVENILRRYDRSGTKLSVLPYHAALTQEARLQSLQDFLSSQNREIPAFLVCTDRASRGLDSVGVERVILFDYPRDPSEYIRRVGRTARAGNAGKVFVFVVGKQVTLARKVMARNEKRHPVHTVPGAST